MDFKFEKHFNKKKKKGHYIFAKTNMQGHISMANYSTPTIFGGCWDLY